MIRGPKYGDNRDAESIGNMHRPRIVGDKELATMNESHQGREAGLTGPHDRGVLHHRGN